MKKVFKTEIQTERWKFLLISFIFSRVTELIQKKEITVCESVTEKNLQKWGSCKVKSW